MTTHNIRRQRREKVRTTKMGDGNAKAFWQQSYRLDADACPTPSMTDHSGRKQCPGSTGGVLLGVKTEDQRIGMERITCNGAKKEKNMLYGHINETAIRNDNAHQS